MIPLIDAFTKVSALGHRPSRLLLAGLVLLVMGCGRGEAASEGLTVAGERTAIADVALSSLLSSDLAVSPTGDQLAIVDGAAEGDSGRKLVAHISAADGSTSQAVADGLPPLVLPYSWWNEGDLFVFGRECPGVEIEVLTTAESLTRVCGEETIDSVYKFDGDAREWTTLIRDVPSNENGDAFPYAAYEDFALLGGAEGGRPVLFVLDVKSGELRAAGPDPFADGGAHQACPLGNGAFLLVTTEGAVGDTLKPSSALFATRVDETGQVAIEVPDDPTNPAPAAPSGCSSTGDVLLQATGGSVPLIRLEDSRLERADLALPVTVDDDRRVVDVRDSVVWTANPKGAGYSGSFLGVNDQWQTIPGPDQGYDAPNEAVIFDGGIVALTGTTSEIKPEFFR